MALVRPPYKKKTKSKQPFYEPPKEKTSSDIVSEARKELKAVKTRRPDTPGDAERHLFGAKQSDSEPKRRPPSVYSLGRRHFNEGDLSRPPTGQKLSPLDRRPSAGSLERIPQELDPTPPTPSQSFSNMSSLAQTSFQHEGVHLGRVSATVGETVQGGSVVTSLREQEARESYHKDTAVVKEYDTLLKSSRIVSADALTGKSHDLASCSHTEPTVPRHHSAGEHTCGTTSGVKRSPSSPKDKVTVHWNSHILPLLNELHPSVHDSHEVCRLLDLLWEKLSSGNYLGRSGGVGGTKKRSAVLKAVFVLLDSKDPQLLLKVAKILLAMRVTGNNLQNACKLIFTISKDERNDPFFASEQIIGILLDVLGGLDPLAQPDAVVYSSGAVKLLCSNSELRGQLVSGGVIKCISTLLKKLKEVPSGSSLQTSSILIQIVGALRNLSDDISLREQFITEGVISGLCALLDDHKRDEELMFVVSRLFSKLTLHSDCCMAFGSCREVLPSFCELLQLHASNPDLVVRVCFVLGNITTTEDETRKVLYERCGLLPILNCVFGRYVTQSQDAKDNKEKRNKCEDVVIKLQRVLANLAIDEEVGHQAASNMECMELLTKVIELKSQWLGEEVLSNALAAVNNLTYYAAKSGPWVQNCEKITTTLLDVLLGSSKEAMLDCLRVYGNLSRHWKVCHVIVQRKVGEVVITLLDSEDVELVYAACGVLLNLMAVQDLRSLLSDNGGVKKLIEVLGDFGQNDWQLSSLVCKTLWNFSDKLTSSVLCFGMEEADLIAEQLEVYLDEEHVVESLPCNVPEDARAYLYSSWKNEFCPVAVPLLDRVKQHQTSLVPL